ncbi:MAG: hypothetical protein PHP69_04595 [Candidatus Omnitrophica bacterium]|nr:hypothetical protein [Candidatus Omnitrophota bacterium]
MFKIKKAQSTAEYAILFALVITAAMGIQTYVKRGLQARVYDAVNDFVSTTGGTTAQYEPSSGTKTTTDQEQSRTFKETPDSDTPFTYEEKSSASYSSKTVQ